MQLFGAQSSALLEKPTQRRRGPNHDRLLLYQAGSGRVVIKNVDYVIEHLKNEAIAHGCELGIAHRRK